jgi:hypothetical protein
LVFQQEDAHHVDLIMWDLAIFALCRMIFTPGADHIAQGFAGPFDAILNGVIRAFL